MVRSRVLRDWLPEFRPVSSRGPGSCGSTWASTATADIDRYKLYRRTGTDYEQVTKERVRSPKATVRQIHLALVARGYEGPPPEFGELWASLFAPVAAVVRPGRAA